MLYFANVFLIFFYGRLIVRPWLTEVRESFTRGGTLGVIREVITWIFSWSSLNYRVGQKVTKFGVFSDPTRKLAAHTPEYCNSEKKLVKHRWLLYT